MKEYPNLTYIRNLSAGDAVFEEKLIAIMKREFVKEKQAFIDRYESGFYIDAANLVHKIKHKVILLGLNKSYELSQNFERDLHEGKTDLYEKFVRILGVMDQYISDI
ncbi:MAG: Hpt domain-containing protein [Flavobacteriaceae bacterium]|nr:Hpt domain-containing protein [Flavobacteriaceae bacterium]